MRSPAVLLAVALLAGCDKSPVPPPAPAQGWRPEQTQDPEQKKRDAEQLLANASTYLQAGHLYHASESVVMLSSRYRDVVDQDKVRELERRVNAAVASAPEEGWRDTRWGMSKSEIKALYPQIVIAGDRGFGMVGFLDHGSDATFLFADDKLAGVNLSTPFLRSDEIEQLLSLMQEKYGPPTTTAEWVRRFETLHSDIDVTAFADKLDLRYRSRKLSKQQVESTLTKERMLEAL